MPQPLVIIEDAGAPPELQLAVPDFARHSSGLLLPVLGFARAAKLPIAIPGEILPRPEFGIVLRKLPSPADQIRTWANEDDWGLTESSDTDTLVRVRSLPFEFAIIVVSRLAAIVGHNQLSASAQRYAAQQLFQDPTMVAVAEEIVRTRNRLLFVEQHLVRLARLLILHAKDVTREVPPTPEELGILRRAVIGMSSLRGLDEPSRDDPQRWLPLMVQAGAYTATDPILEDTARVKSLYIDLAGRHELRGADFDPQTWAGEDEGLTLEQQWTLAFQAIGKTDILGAGEAAWTGAILPESWSAEVAQRLRVQPEVIERVIIGDRSWYSEAFSEHRDDRRYATWDRRPFDERPLLRLSTGELLVISPRSFESWMTDGFYHRALNSARKRNRLPQFQTRLGHVVEAYALELMKAAHPGDRPAGSGVVHGDRPYSHPRHGARRTPDIAIDRWEDLVLIEVTAGRLTHRTLVEGDVKDDIDRKVVAKIHQLSSRIDDLFAGHFEIDGVAVEAVKRIWPLVVVPGRLLQHPLLWEYVRRAVGDCLTQPRVQAVTLLDLAELETLAGLIEQGVDLIEILRRKTSPFYAQRDFRRMVLDDPGLDARARCSLVSRRAEQLFELVGAELGLSREQFTDAARKAA